MTDHLAVLEELAKEMRYRAGDCYDLSPRDADSWADRITAAIALMRGQSGAVSLLDKKYDAESLYDATRDFGEALDENFTPAWKEMPTDQYGFAKGEFRVRFTWTPPKEDSADEQ